MSIGGFYLKFTRPEAETFFDTCKNLIGYLQDLTLDNYTYSIEDTATGDLYWRVDNYAEWKIADLIKANYPDLVRYDYEFVKQFIPQPELP